MLSASHSLFEGLGYKALDKIGACLVVTRCYGYHGIRHFQGIPRTCILKIACRPSSAIKKLMDTARTGRLIKTSVKRIMPPVTA
ncbi:hypothetical protein O9929_00075 [Vibrio lentus]|nr:hypothetical protein [Vibrio lentus]